MGRGGGAGEDKTPLLINSVSCHSLVAILPSEFKIEIIPALSRCGRPIEKSRWNDGARPDRFISTGGVTILN